MSRRMNLIAVLDPAGAQVLMCLRKKTPYQGLYNLVGGKVEPGETGLQAAQRELREETGYSPKEVSLLPLMEMEDIPRDIHLEIWGGQLSVKLPFVEELNTLRWFPCSDNFRDLTRFAGDGNLQIIVDACRERTR